MIIIEDITVNEYISIEDDEVKKEYDYAIKYAYIYNKPKDYYKLGDIMKLPFGWIKDFQYALSEGMVWDDYIKLISVFVKKPYNEKLLRLCQQRVYLINAMEELIYVEEKALSSSLSSDEESAGMDDFDGFGIELQFRNLTGGDVTKKDDVRNIPYEDCFVELVLQKKISDYERRLMNIRKIS